MVTTLEELKSKVNLLSVGILKACEDLKDVPDIATLTLVKREDKGVVKAMYHSFTSRILYTDKRLHTLITYLEERLQLSPIESITYYVPSKKIVFTFNQNRIFLDPSETYLELSNYPSGTKRELPKESIRLEVDLIQLLLKDSANLIAKIKIEAKEANRIANEQFKTSDTFKELLESVNRTVSFSRQYTTQPSRGIARSQWRDVWNQDDLNILDTAANRAVIAQREAIEREAHEATNNHMSFRELQDQLQLLEATTDVERQNLAQNFIITDELSD